MTVHAWINERNGGIGGSVRVGCMTRSVDAIRSTVPKVKAGKKGDSVRGVVFVGRHPVRTGLVRDITAVGDRVGVGAIGLSRCSRGGVNEAAAFAIRARSSHPEGLSEYVQQESAQ